ncbi:hypothetical protein A6R68_07551, partial [Neotoma lepida]
RGLPKPIPRAQPDSVVSKLTMVIFFCEGTRGAKAHRLYKEEYQYLWIAEISQNPKNKPEFSISKIDQQHAGQYLCQYQTHGEWSEYRDSLELVTPSLSSQPSPVVTEGENVTLQCVSRQQNYRFILAKKGTQNISQMLDSYTRPYSLWALGPPAKGTLHKPTIKAEPGSVVTAGSSITIWCQGTLDTEMYVLHKEGSQNPWNTQSPEKPENKAKFSIPSVTQEHVRQYHCHCYSSAGWSEHSDSLEIMVTGIYYSKPSLTALPSPVVTSAGNMTLVIYKVFCSAKTTCNTRPQRDIQMFGYYNDTPQLWSVPSEALETHISGLSKKLSLVTHQGHILDPGKILTLQCCSDINYDRFALYKLGGADFTQHDGQWAHGALSLANFTLGSVSSSTTGQYRCYGAHNLSSEWSAFSDSLDILIKGEELNRFYQ